MMPLRVISRPFSMGRPPTCDCGECQKCKQRVYMRGWYNRQSAEKKKAILAARDPERVRQADRKRYWQDENRRDRKARPQKGKAQWREQNPEKYAAHIAVATALKGGTLSRMPCEACGAGDTHAHHDDYSKPLDVRWLCPPCHGKEHITYREDYEAFAMQPSTPPF